MNSLTTMIMCDTRNRGSRGLRSSFVQSLYRTVLVMLITTAVGFTVAIDASRAATCSNESVRAESNSLALPDCRAYEQVTPPFKQGHVIYTTEALAFIGSSGTSVLAPSVGVFAGTEDANTGPSITSSPYQFTREPSGWTTKALSPSATEFTRNEGNIRLAASNLAESLFALSKRSSPGVEEFYVRHADGSLADIGAPLPAGQSVENDRAALLLANSADLSHILLTLELGRWPGDTTPVGVEQYKSLYAFAPDSAEPKLVAVRNTGSLKSDSEAQLIGNCGVSAHFETEGLHEMSADGETIVFSVNPCFENPGEPEVKEIYARLAGEKTLAISEPSLPPGEECTATCAGAELKSANLEGATESGKQIFFTTEQPLLNSDKDLGRDLYEAEIEGQGANARVSKVTNVSQGGVGDPTPGEGAGVLGVTEFSRDASQVYFVAEGILTSVANSQGQKAIAGSPNLYQVELATGRTVFVTTLSTEDSFDWGPRFLAFRQLSQNGRFLTFSSFKDLTPDDTSSGLWQLFQFDAQTNSLVRVSAGEEGFNNDGNTSEDFPLLGSALSVAEDGAVFFSTSAALTPGASSDPEHLLRNVYEYREGHVGLIAPGSTLNYLEGTESATHLWGTDETGENVFFLSSASLTPSDEDTQTDLYDARAGGGFPAPTAAECNEETCQGSPAGSSAPLAPGTSSFSGPGNPKPRHAHKRRKHPRRHHHKVRSRRHHQHGAREAGTA